MAQTMSSTRRFVIQKFGTSTLLRVGGALEHRLAEQQILLDWRDFDTGPPLIEALAAGDIDIGSAGEVPPIFAQENGAPILYVACEQAAPSSVAVVVRDGSPVDGMLDLRGRRVALSPRANVHLLLMRASDMHGVSVADAAQSPAGAAYRLSGPFGMEQDGLELAMRRLAAGARNLDDTVMRDQQGVADRFYSGGLLPRAISVQDALWSRAAKRR